MRYRGMPPSSRGFTPGMCLDRRAYRSFSAWKGWQTRRARAARELQLALALPSRVGKDRDVADSGNDRLVLGPSLEKTKAD
jgi:hypothetical protein